MWCTLVFEGSLDEGVEGALVGETVFFVEGGVAGGRSQAAVFFEAERP